MKSYLFNRPNMIEAVSWDGTEAHAEQIFKWVEAKGEPAWMDRGGVIKVVTDDTSLVIDKNSYLVWYLAPDGSGHFCRLEKHYFEATTEPRPWAVNIS